MCTHAAIVLLNLHTNRLCVPGSDSFFERLLKSLPDYLKFKNGRPFVRRTTFATVAVIQASSEKLLTHDDDKTVTGAGSSALLALTDGEVDGALSLVSAASDSKSAEGGGPARCSDALALFSATDSDALALVSATDSDTLALVSTVGGCTSKVGVPRKRVIGGRLPTKDIVPRRPSNNVTPEITAAFASYDTSLGIEKPVPVLQFGDALLRIHNVSVRTFKLCIHINCSMSTSEAFFPSADREGCL